LQGVLLDPIIRDGGGRTGWQRDRSPRQIF
jgi:hypothetical protein